MPRKRALQAEPQFEVVPGWFLPTEPDAFLIWLEDVVNDLRTKLVAKSSAVAGRHLSHADVVSRGAVHARGVEEVGYELAPGILREPIGLWRRVLCEIRAAYTVASHLRNGRTVDRAAWEPLRGILLFPVGPGDPPSDGSAPETIGGLPGSAAPWVAVDPTTVDGQPQALAAVIGAWLAIGAVRPTIAWGGLGRAGDPVMALGVSTLFGGLVLELLLAIAGQVGIAMCSGCGEPHVPRRHLATGRFAEPARSYCPTCRSRHAAQNGAAKRWRDKHPEYSRERRAKRKAPDPGPKAEARRHR